jgi:hypothetical protein
VLGQVRPGATAHEAWQPTMNSGRTATRASACQLDPLAKAVQSAREARHARRGHRAVARPARAHR